MSGYVLGMDGGGTKSHLAVFRLDGALKGARAWGALNHESLEGSYAQMEAELTAFTRGALAEMSLGVSDIDNAVLGLAGCDTPAQHALISDMIRRVGFEQFTLTNDAFIGIHAVAPVDYGVCAINGTGQALAAIDKSGAFAQIGGIGELSDDCGGGGWFASKAIGAAYNDLFRSGEKTALTEKLLSALGAETPARFVEILTSGEYDYKILNHCVFRAADEGDAAALAILRQSAQSYGGSIAHIARSMDFPEGDPLYVTLAGSVFIKEPSAALPNMIRAYTDNALPNRDVRYLKLTAPPVAGAVVWALKNAGAAVDKPRVCALCADML